MPDKGPPHPTHAGMADRDVFEGGPPRRLTALARLPAPICPNHISRVTLVFVMGWGVLLLLVAVTPSLAGQGALGSFWRDTGVHARFAIAAPALVAAYAICARRLGDVAYHFLFSNLLDDYGKAHFADSLVRVRRLVNSLWAEAVTIALAYGLVLLLYIFAQPSFEISPWQIAPGGESFSPAGWWHTLVSFPLLGALLFGWLWRIAIWIWFLRGVARLDLRLIAAHPDQAGGLGFLSQSVQAFSILGFAMGSIVAGRFAYLHSAGLSSRMRDGLLIGGTAVFVAALCIGPLLAFSGLLFRAWRDGSRTYGALATELGDKFERKWFAPPAERDEDILSVPDFSAGTDYYQIVSNVYAIRFVPVDVRSLLILLAATLGPFIPAMFLSMPSTVVIQELIGLFLR